MNLCKRFAEVSSSRYVNISSLENEKPYSVTGAERAQTKYGISMLSLSRRLPQTSCVYSFLDVWHIFSDVESDMIMKGLSRLILFIMAHVKRVMPISSHWNRFKKENEKPYLNVLVYKLLISCNPFVLQHNNSFAQYRGEWHKWLETCTFMD